MHSRDEHGDEIASSDQGIVEDGAVVLHPAMGAERVKLHSDHDPACQSTPPEEARQSERILQATVSDRNEPADRQEAQDDFVPHRRFGRENLRRCPQGGGKAFAGDHEAGPGKESPGLQQIRKGERRLNRLILDKASDGRWMNGGLDRAAGRGGDNGPCAQKRFYCPARQFSSAARRQQGLEGRVGTCGKPEVPDSCQVQEYAMALHVAEKHVLRQMKGAHFAFAERVV